MENSLCAYLWIEHNLYNIAYATTRLHGIEHSLTVTTIEEKMENNIKYTYCRITIYYCNRKKGIKKKIRAICIFLQYLAFLHHIRSNKYAKCFPVNKNSI